MLMFDRLDFKITRLKTTDSPRCFSKNINSLMKLSQKYSQTYMNVSNKMAGRQKSSNCVYLCSR